MNSLSWMIYLAEVVNSLNIVLMVAFWLSLVGGILLYLIGISAGGEWLSDSAQHKVNKKVARETYRLLGKRCLIGTAIVAPLAIITPSSQTIYMISASQAGETIIKTPEAQEVFNDLKTIIKSKLKEQLPKPQ